ncbi:hypothetical protein D917_02409 [Trichinella nativa]|uniref:Uncharacterized protein n=1 Tax=Trichinella nativa TaxID=6335 RepID=A0A1Y3EFI9_9BILA|nr:hypothetical protein D917_02409 [Trichinella nativa]
MEKQQQQQRSTAISDKVLFSDRMLGPHLETTPIFAGNIFNCIGGRVVFNRSGIVSSTTISSVLGMPCSR